MKIFLVIFLFIPGFFLLAESSAEKINELEMAITRQRMQVIKKDGDAANLYARILREYKKLDDQLQNHSKIKNSKLDDKALTALKLKLLQEDEDLNDSRQRIIKQHRLLEDILRKNTRLKKLYTQLQKLKK